MNTLSKEVTATFFRDPDGWKTFNNEFKARASKHDPSLTAFDYFMAQVLRGKDWTKSVGTLTNPNKLVNGGRYNWTPFKVLKQLYELEGRVNKGGRWLTDLQLAGKFNEKYHFLTDDALTKIEALLPDPYDFFKCSRDGVKVTPYLDSVIDLTSPEKIAIERK